MLAAILAAASEPLQRQPFTTSVAGAIMLLLIGALFAFVFTYVPSRFKEQRVRSDALLVQMTRLTDAVLPDNRPGLVQRVENLESLCDALSRELETHQTLAASQRLELIASINQVRDYCDRVLASARQ